MMDATKIKPMNFKIDSRSPMPVYEQIKQQIKLLILSGHLEEGDQLVPIRDLAAVLQVNANTIVKVYYQLGIEGYISPQHGSGFFVTFHGREAQPDQKELFIAITEEYVARGSQLGFSLEDMVKELKRRMKKP